MKYIYFRISYTMRNSCDKFFEIALIYICTLFSAIERLKKNITNFESQDFTIEENIFIRSDR